MRVGTCLGRKGPCCRITSAFSHIKAQQHAAMTKNKFHGKKRWGRENERFGEERLDAINTHIEFGNRGGARIRKAKRLCHMRCVGHERRGSCNCAPPAASGVPDDETDQQRSDYDTAHYTAGDRPRTRAILV